jgi:CcmD family protein
MVPDTFPSLFWSYNAIWGVLAVYIITLGLRVSRLERRLSEKKDRADESAKQSA